MPVTTTTAFVARVASSTQMWLDDVAYSGSGTPPPSDTTPPTAPATLAATDHVGDQGAAVDLSWAAATDDVGVTGYRISRGTAPGVYSTTIPLGAVTSYTDATAVTGTRYYYAVTALEAGNASARSPEASAIALDNLAPATPAGLAATGGTASVALAWTANTETDLAGYNVYRDGIKINLVPVTAASYTDTGRAAATTYAYRLGAVDTHGNESAQCAAVSATTGPATPPATGLVDTGFENGTDAVLLASPPWSVSGVPQHREYDTARAKVGSLSAWIQGAAAGSNAGVYETASGAMTSVSYTHLTLPTIYSV